MTDTQYPDPQKPPKWVPARLLGAFGGRGTESVALPGCHRPRGRGHTPTDKSPQKSTGARRDGEAAFGGLWGAGQLERALAMFELEREVARKK
jgi:hypothetical protein